MSLLWEEEEEMMDRTQPYASEQADLTCQSARHSRRLYRTL
jgi:hypothetical protein